MLKRHLSRKETIIVKWLFALVTERYDLHGVDVLLALFPVTPQLPVTSLGVIPTNICVCS